VKVGRLSPSLDSVKAASGGSSETGRAPTGADEAPRAVGSSRAALYQRGDERGHKLGFEISMEFERRELVFIGVFAPCRSQHGVLLDFIFNSIQTRFH
jgi:hypothetical protein